MINNKRYIKILQDQNTEFAEMIEKIDKLLGEAICQIDPRSCYMSNSERISFADKIRKQRNQLT